ncbi:DUF5103 domain-containing protein, partial [Polaribacter sp.]|nr:DUF5103 domain-containing protein [Polaribacter sp.]
SQYIDGFDQNYFTDISNSFNTYQNYTHYSITIPNNNTVITKSGNYLLSILDDNEEVVSSRRFVYYESNATVGVSVVRSRNALTVNTQQTVEFSVYYPNIPVKIPEREINVVLIKNNNWNKTITGLQPTFFKQNQLQYSYTNKTNFWADNEYLNFDSKIIRNNSMNVVRVERKDLFHHYIYPFEYDKYQNYRYNPDINGQFVIRTLEGNDLATEADYAVMHFSLLAEAPFLEKAVHVYGAFNNFDIEHETRLYYDETKKMYQGEILLKQGFYNYTFATVDDYGEVNTHEINGSYFETENEYNVIVYYKPIGGFYDRVIGIGTGFFNLDR